MKEAADTTKLNSTSNKTQRSFYVFYGLVLVAGGLVFSWGGSSHPPTDTTLGVIGSNTYYRNFINHVVSHPTWELSHTAILIGPLLWSLGSAGVTLALRRRVGESNISSVALVLSAMGSVMWAATFVFDGFVAPEYARAFVESGDPVAQESAMLGFRANEALVVRLGLAGWIMIGLAMAAYSASMLAASTFARIIRLPIAAIGILLGMWPLLAWLVGIFQPGPFTSPLWAPTALLTASWYLAFGGILAAQPLDKLGMWHVRNRNR